VSASPASSRVLTLVFTDLAGSTALKSERGDEAGSALISRHRRLLAGLAQEHGGRIVDSAGDGTFLTFEAPSTGARFALALQAAHAAAPELPRVRVGIHLGEVSEREGRVEGLAVDLAARLAGLALPSQVLLSAAAAGSARQRIPHELGGREVHWRSHGAFALKGASEPIEVHEVGLEGLSPLRPPSPGEKARPLTSSHAPRALATSVVALLAVAAGAWWTLGRDSTTPLTTPVEATAGGEASAGGAGAKAGIRSLAVLPLANLSGDPEQEYYADGLTETLIAELAKLPGVRVVSRTSVMQFKGAKTPLPEIGKQLKVDGVIEGSVMRSENQVRITAQLIDARSDEHVWAEQYDRELARVLEIQSEVARAVAIEIALAITPEQRARLAPPKPVDPRALEAFYRGLALRDQEDQEGERAAQQSFEEVVAIAPEFAPAWAALSIQHTQSCIWGCADSAGVGAKARAAAERALALEPDLGDAHTAMGRVLSDFAWDWVGAESELRRAAELSSRTDRFGAGASLCFVLLQLGRRTEAIEECERWSADSPDDLFFTRRRVDYLILSGRISDAELESARTLPRYPESAELWSLRAIPLELSGRFEEAVRASRKVFLLRGSVADAEAIERGWRIGGKDGYWRAWEQFSARSSAWVEAAGSAAQRGDRDAAFAHLETAFAKHDPMMRRLIVHPYLRPLHSDPRFTDLARRMNLPLPKP
jgi:TolB-like protein/class 3 adenylate cyclase